MDTDLLPNTIIDAPLQCVSELPEAEQSNDLEEDESQTKEEESDSDSEEGETEGEGEGAFAKKEEDTVTINVPDINHPDEDDTSNTISFSPAPSLVTLVSRKEIQQNTGWKAYPEDK